MKKVVSLSVFLFCLCATISGASTTRLRGVKEEKARNENFHPNPQNYHRRTKKMMRRERAFAAAALAGGALLSAGVGTGIGIGIGLLIANAPSAAPSASPSTNARFNFQSTYDSNFPAARQTLAQAGFNVLETIITGDITDETLTSSGTDCTDAPTTIDDTYICNIYGGTFDANVLAFAGPKMTRTAGSTNQYLPITGQINVNPASTPSLSDNEFQQLMEHEALHIMGIGTLWDNFNLVTNPNTATCEYNANTKAAAFFQAITGCTSTMAIPMEATVCGHWDETCFGGMERMVPTLQSAAVISTVTAGSLEDMGYTVDYTAASTLTDVSFSATCMCAARATPGANFPEKPPLSPEGREIANAEGLAHLARNREKYYELQQENVLNAEYVGHKVVSVLYKEGEHIYDVVVHAPW